MTLDPAVEQDLHPHLEKPQTLFRRTLGMPRVWVGGGILLGMVLLCVGTLPLTLSDTSPMYYNDQKVMLKYAPPGPAMAEWFGYDALGRSILSQCLLGGTISLGIGLAAALISVVLGVGVGLLAGYRGGWVDALLMRTVDVMYGLPYLLLVILLRLALYEPLERVLGGSGIASIMVLFVAIGLVSWLTMARVVRGQVLSLRGMPFIEAARAAGITERRVFFRHLLPNLAGPVIVYATLTVPQAILQESFLSFLGIGVQLPMTSWGLLAADSLRVAFDPTAPYWWALLFPCIFLALTLLSLNFLGDGLRDLFDPRRESAKL